MQVISEQNLREKRDLERVQRKLDKIAQRQKEAGKNTANVNEHYICKLLSCFISTFVRLRMPIRWQLRNIGMPLNRHDAYYSKNG